MEYWQAFDGEQLSAPTVENPIYACSQVVRVSDAQEGLDILLYEVGGNQIGQGVANGQGTARINLSTPLNPTQQVYATQSDGNDESPDSNVVTVDTYEGELPQPRIARTPYDCGRKISIQGLIPGVSSTITEDVNWNTDVEWPANYNNEYYAQLHSLTPDGTHSQGGQVQVQQIVCPYEDPESEMYIESDPSDWVGVQDDPEPVPQPDPAEWTVGDSYFHIPDGMIVGANLDVYDEGNYEFTMHPGWEHILVRRDITSDTEIALSQYFCGEPPEPVTGTGYPQDRLEEVLQPPAIVEPVCPGEPQRTVYAKASMLGGKLGVFDASTGEFLGGETSPSGSTTGLNLRDDVELTPGQDIEVIHRLQAGYERSSFAEVADFGASILLMSGETSHESQNTGGTIEGFVREESAGPLFRLHSCCVESESDSVNIVIKRDNGDGSFTSYDAVELVKIRDNVYEGRWNWLVPNVSTPDGIWPPPANYTYSVEIESLPCTEAELIEELPTFEVLTGETDESDTTPPTLDLTVAQGSFEVGDDGASLEVTPGEEIPVSLSVKDRQGVKRAMLDVSGDSEFVNSGSTLEKLAQVMVPIPGELTLSENLEPLAPFETVTIDAEGETWATLEQIQSITVEGRFKTPVITDITPSQAYSNDTIDISGKHLYYSTTETKVRFSAPGGTVLDEINVSNGTSSLLSNISLSGLAGVSGTVNVEVGVRKANTSDPWVFSDAEQIELLDRDQTFQSPNPTGTDFTQQDSGTCEASGSNVIEEVTVLDDPAGYPQNRLLQIQYFDAQGNSQSDSIAFDSFANPDLNEDQGGYILFDSCKTIALLSFRPNNGNSPPTFTLVWWSITSDGVKQTNALSGINLYYRDSSGQVQYVPAYLNVWANGDGTIVANTTPVLNSSQATSDAFIEADIVDMLTYDQDHSHQSGVCVSGQSCSFGINLDADQVEVYVNSTEIADLTLGTP